MAVGPLSDKTPDAAIQILGSTGILSSTQGGSDKFYMCHVGYHPGKGRYATWVQHGRNGANGQARKPEYFSNAQAAVNMANAHMSDKFHQRKGYQRAASSSISNHPHCTFDAGAAQAIESKAAQLGLVKAPASTPQRGAKKFPAKATKKTKPAARPSSGSLSQDVAADVDQYIASTSGITKSEAFEVVAQDRGISKSSVQQHYYRYKRKLKEDGKQARSAAPAKKHSKQPKLAPVDAIQAEAASQNLTPAALMFGDM